MIQRKSDKSQKYSHMTEAERKECGRCCSVAIPMRIACRMLHTVYDLACLLDPMAGRVQVFPCAVRVIFEIVKGAVGLGFDGDGALCRKGRAGY